jgi:hypothetical protein
MLVRGRRRWEKECVTYGGSKFEIIEPSLERCVLVASSDRHGDPLLIAPFDLLAMTRNRAAGDP